jgi:hypothetical protein
MSTHLLLAEMGNVVPGVGVAFLNVIVALALVAVSLLLVLAVSSVAWLYDRHKEFRSIRGHAEQRALA